MTERAYQAGVIQIAQLLGWRVAHFRPGRTADGSWRTPVAADGAGFPDLVMVRRDRIIYAELKARRGRVSAAQHAWLNALTTAGAACFVWVEGTNSLEEIKEVLR